MIYGQRFRSAITSNLRHYWGMSEVVIVWLDRNLFFNFFLLQLTLTSKKKSQVSCDMTFHSLNLFF